MPTMFLTVGDVIDMRGAYVRQNKTGQAHLMCLLRMNNNENGICMIADRKYEDLITARITSIDRVANISRYVCGKWKNFTNAYVQLEDAFGEKPLYAAKNSSLFSMTKSKSDKFWEKPEFKTGVDANGKEEK